MAGSISPKFEGRDISEAIVNMVRSMLPAFQEVRPTRAKVEFGLEFNAGSGGVQPVIAKGIDNGHVRITLEWETEKE